MNSAIELFRRPIARLPAVLLVSAAVVIALLLLPRGAAGFNLLVEIDGPTTDFLAGTDVPYVVSLQLDDQELLGATITVDLEGPGSFVTRSMVGLPIGPDGLSFGPIQSETPNTDVSISGDITHENVASDVELLPTGYGYGYGYQGLGFSAIITIDGTLSLPGDAPSGEYSLIFTVDNGPLPGEPESVTVTLTVRPFQHTTIPEGWSTFSIPITAEQSTTNGRFYATANLGTAAQNGLVDPDKVKQAFKFNAATQLFELIVIDEASNNTPLLPTEALYVESESAHDATLIYEDGQSGPPSQELFARWNLVGLAVPLGQTTMDAKQALISVEEAPDGDTGYTIVVSPSINPDPFILTKPLTTQNLTVSRGYWVFMENGDFLAGFSTTPVVEP